MKENINTEYYLSIRSKMIREFNAMYKGARKELSVHFNEGKIDYLQQKSQSDYEKLFEELSYIGGRENADTINLIMGVITLSILRPLEREKLTDRQIGKVIYEAFNGYFEARPNIISRIVGYIATSKFYAGKMKKQIELSSRRKYEDDFVSEYVETEGKDFDFGYNYVECAIHKLFKTYKVERFLKYVCLGDYVMFRSFGIGFTRTQTIANGASFCDFRFRRKGETYSGWPPDDLPEWSET